MQIEDGKGKGTIAEVSSDNKLATTSVHISTQQHTSGAHGRAYQVSSGIRSATGAYGILALRNDGTNNLVITYIRVGIDKTETAQALIQVYMGGTWTAGVATQSPVNLNARFAVESGITSHYASIPVGNPRNIDVMWLKGPGEVVYRKEGSIILPTNGLLSIKVTPETAAVNVHARVSFIMLTDREIAEL